MKRLTQFLREEMERLPTLGGALPFTLRPLADLHALLDDPDSHVPAPWTIRRKDGGVLHAYPVLEGSWAGSLRVALRSYLREEAARAGGPSPGDEAQRKDHLRARSSLAREIERCLEHCSFSSYGPLLSSVFWLLLSAWSAQELGRLPHGGPEGGAAPDPGLRYRVFGRLSALLHETSVEVNRRIAEEFGGGRGEFLSALLLPMRENVLIFTEESLDPALVRLAAYLRGSAEVDPEGFLRRISETRELARELVRKDAVVGEAVRAFYGAEPEGFDLDRALFDGRLVELVLHHPRHDPKRGLHGKEADLFRDLSRRLRLFDLLHMLRRRVLRVRDEGGELRARVGGQPVPVERETQMLDFSLPGVMDNMVFRHGMLYDIKDFTATLQAVRRQGPQREKLALRHMFLFHQLLYDLERAHQLSMEKFLGDGAFYTGPSCRKLLDAAIRLRDLYEKLKERGLVFDRGIRIALNHSYYNILPIRSGAAEGGYLLEFHGPGLVELSRLTTGKSDTELRGFKEDLVAHGYDSEQVHRFFEPMERTEAAVSRDGERGPHIDRYGALVNEGIVASRPFVERLSEELGSAAPLREVSFRGRRHVAIPFEEGRLVGLRELGIAKLKGLEPERVYAVDAVSELEVAEEAEVRAAGLLDALDRGYGRPHRERKGLD